MNNPRNTRLDCGHIQPRKEHRWITASGQSQCPTICAKQGKDSKHSK